MGKHARIYSVLATIVVAGAAIVAAGVSAQPYVIEGGRIYVPEPKDADDTLDNTETTSIATSGDMDIVTTRQGDRLTGRVTGIEADGRLRLTSPQFAGEALVEVTALDQIAFSCKRGRADLDEVLITNGDRILGELLAITPDAVVVESDATGILKVRRNVVRAIVLSKPQRRLIEGDFEAGRMAPWNGRSGTWTIGQGGLICGAAGATGRVNGRVREVEEEGIWGGPQVGGVAPAPAQRLVGPGAAAREEEAELAIKAAARAAEEAHRAAVGAAELALKAAAREAKLQREVALQRRDAWIINDGGFGRIARPVSPADQYAGISAPLEQKGALTIEAKVEDMGGSPLNCSLVLLADAIEGGHGRNSVGFRVVGNEWRLELRHNGNTRKIAGNALGRDISKGVFTMACDPAAGKARLWLDSAELGTFNVPNMPASGRYVMFNAGCLPPTRIRVSYIRVLAGNVPPSPGENEAQENSDTLRLDDESSISANSITMADGVFAVGATYGELRCPIEKVNDIAFRKQGREEPRRSKGDVRVYAQGRCLTLQIDRLTGEHLIGKSDYFEPVMVARDALSLIQFNIHD